MAVERFLALREPGGRPRLSAADISPFAQPLLEALFGAFQHPERWVLFVRQEAPGSARVSPAPIRQHTHTHTHIHTHIHTHCVSRTLSHSPSQHTHMLTDAFTHTHKPTPLPPSPKPPAAHTSTSCGR